MKQYVRNLMVAAIAVVMVPGALLAQEVINVEKEKSNLDQIIINRVVTASEAKKNEKVVIEIEGEKIKVNGKEVEGGKNKDITIRRNKLQNVDTYVSGGGENFTINWNNDRNVSLFREDSNRAMLGVTTDTHEDDKIKGAYITTISKESSAEKAGLQKGDVITRIGDKTIEDADDVSVAVRSHKPGDKVTVNYVRNGKNDKVTAELGRWKGVRIHTTTAPTIPAMPFVRSRDGFSTGSQPKLGLSVQDTDDGKGVKVLSVTDDGHAAKAGIKKDDIITEVNNNEVSSADEVAMLIRANRNKSVMNLKVMRGGKSQDIELRIPRKLKTADL